MIRLNKFLAANEIASRRKADEFILKGLVEINGEVIRTPGVQVDPENDRVSFEGRNIRLKSQQTMVYAVFKPRNCVTTMSDPENRSKISDFFPPTPHRLFPIGRLDYDSEGLVLLTNNGDLANKIAKPAAKIRKQYFVKIKGILSKADLSLMNGKLTLDRKKLSRMRVSVLHNVNDKTWLEVILTEGKNRQIRRIFEKFNYRVLKIKRFKIANIDLGMLKPGESRRLTREEITKLLQLCGNDTMLKN